MNQGIWLWKLKKYSKKESKKLKLAKELLSCSGNPESHEWQRINSSLQHQQYSDKLWHENEENFNEGMISWFNTKVSELTSWELYSRQWGELWMRFYEWTVLCSNLTISINFLYGYRSKCILQLIQWRTRW